MEKSHVEDTDLLVKDLKDVYFPVNVPRQEVTITGMWRYQQITMLYAPMDQQKPPSVLIENTDPLIIVGLIDDQLLDATDEDIIVILENNSNKALYLISFSDQW